MKTSYFVLAGSIQVWQIIALSLLLGIVNGLDIGPTVFRGRHCRGEAGALRALKPF